MQESTKQIVIAVTAAAAASATAALITHFLTKASTTKDIASGKTPLPAGSTPTMNPANPNDNQPPPKAQPPSPAPAPVNLLNMANQVAQGIQPSIPKCPVGYHPVATGVPNFPWMCIADS